jgi:DNA-binding XRE family transcriptional regulator
MSPLTGEIDKELEEIAEQLLTLSQRAYELRVKHDSSQAGGLPPGRLLALARNRAQLTQTGLAEMTGVHFNTIINFEQGRTHPRTQTLMKLAEAVGIDWETLRADEEYL